MTKATQSKEWYHRSNVPTRPHNKSLGLKDISVYPATQKQKAYDILCTCILHLVCGTITVSIAESQHGSLYVSTPGQTRKNGQFYQNVRLEYDLKAQILKYVESVNFGKEGAQ